MNQQIGKWMMILGALAFIVGILLYFFHDKLYWLGKLPGDIRIEKGNFKIYFPLTTCLIISLLLTIIMYIIRKL